MACTSFFGPFYHTHAHIHTTKHDMHTYAPFRARSELANEQGGTLYTLSSGIPRDLATNCATVSPCATRSKFPAKFRAKRVNESLKRLRACVRSSGQSGAGSLDSSKVKGACKSCVCTCLKCADAHVRF